MATLNLIMFGASLEPKLPPIWTSDVAQYGAPARRRRALLDEFESSRSTSEASFSNSESLLTIIQTKGKKKKTRNYNPNRAREAQRKELLTLRELIPKLQKRLKVLEDENRRRNAARILAESNKSLRMWKKMASLQRQSRANAEEENRRLRAMLLEQSETYTLTVQKLLQTRQSQLQTYQRWSQPWTSRRMYALPLEGFDSAVIREMTESIDAVYHQVLREFCPKSCAGKDDATSSPAFGAENAHQPTFADKILPFDLDATGAAAWQFFAHSFRRPTARFYYHTDSPQSPGLVSDDTVVESFGDEIHFGPIMADLKVKQIGRFYTAADCIVVAWQALISPEKFKGEALSGIVFEEKGALVIKPFSPQKPRDCASIIHTWQMITPVLYSSAKETHSQLVQELTSFVVAGCRPGRAVESMERTLHFQSVPLELVAP